MEIDDFPMSINKEGPCEATCQPETNEKVFKKYSGIDVIEDLRANKNNSYWTKNTISCAADSGEAPRVI